MSGRPIRVLRGVLLLLALSVAGAVGFALRKPVPAPPAQRPETAVPGGTRMDDVVYRSVKDGRESFVLEARRMLGREQEQLRLETVTLRFSYVARGEPGSAEITSDECIYFPTRQEAFFQGHVRLQTADGYELRSESLVYRGEAGEASSEHPVEFRRQGFSGTSTGLHYSPATGGLELLADVFVRIEGEGGEAPTEIRSANAVLSREEGTLRFQGGVTATQGSDVLRSDRLILYGQPGQVERVRAVEQVELKTTGAGSLLGMGRSTGGSGPRELRCQQLDLSFRPDRSLQEASASGGDSELLILPGPGEPRERRRLKGGVLTFRWNDARQLEEIQGQKDTEFRAEPLDAGGAAPRTVKCRNFVARVEPATGETQTIEFHRDVEFAQAARRATGRRAIYDGPSLMLALRDSPVLFDDEQGYRLDAQAIDVATGTGDVAARHDVRHTLEPRPGSGRSLPFLGETAPAIVSCRFFDYEAKSRTARYREGALLRSGKDEVRAPEIRIQEAGEGARRLEATGGVVSLLHPSAEKAGAPPAARLEGRAREMVYDESRREILYRGEAVLRQGDIKASGPSATVHLKADGRGIERLVAGTPAEIVQGVRKATGDRVTYVPAEKKMVVEGAKALLTDPAQQVQGRSLTFYVGDDRILVDGREEARTQTILRKESPRP